MNYATRIKIAAVFSLLIHVAGIALVGYDGRPMTAAIPVQPDSIVLDLQPEPQPQPEAPRRLVDVAVPAPTPPDPSDRIAEEHAESMDLAMRTAERPGPELELDEFDRLPQEAAPPLPPAPAPAPTAPPMKQPAEEKKAPPREAPEVKRDPTPPDRVDEFLPKPSGAPAPPAPEEGPLKIAQAKPLLPREPERGKTRERGGVTKQGETNFDAIQSEIAPYLKQVRDKVERQWNQMLYTRYSGTSPVKAVIDCAINPMGELVSVTVAGTDQDRIYSALCRDAVQRAGPFGPFPFKVPEIYRGKNLEIRWTFSFL